MVQVIPPEVSGPVQCVDDQIPTDIAVVYDSLTNDYRRQLNDWPLSEDSEEQLVLRSDLQDGYREYWSPGHVTPSDAGLIPYQMGESSDIIPRLIITNEDDNSESFSRWIQIGPTGRLPSLNMLINVVSYFLSVIFF